MSIVQGDAEIEGRAKVGLAHRYADWRPNFLYYEGDYADVSGEVYRAMSTHRTGATFAEKEDLWKLDEQALGLSFQLSGDASGDLLIAPVDGKVKIDLVGGGSLNMNGSSQLTLWPPSDYSGDPYLIKAPGNYGPAREYIFFSNWGSHWFSLESTFRSEITLYEQPFTTGEVVGSGTAIRDDKSGVVDFFGDGIALEGDAALGKITISIPEYVGATDTLDGTTGALTPPPYDPDNVNLYLRGDGQWIDLIDQMKIYFDAADGSINAPGYLTPGTAYTTGAGKAPADMGFKMPFFRIGSELTLRHCWKDTETQDGYDANTPWSVPFQFASTGADPDMVTTLQFSGAKLARHYDLAILSIDAATPPSNQATAVVLDENILGWTRLTEFADGGAQPIEAHVNLHGTMLPELWLHIPPDTLNFYNPEEDFRCRVIHLHLPGPPPLIKYNTSNSWQRSPYPAYINGVLQTPPGYGGGVTIPMDSSHRTLLILIYSPLSGENGYIDFVSY